MLKDNKLLDYIDVFSPKEYEKNDEIILEFFSVTLNFVLWIDP